MTNSQWVPGRRRRAARRVARPLTPPAQPRPKTGTRRTSARRPSRGPTRASRLGVAMPVVETVTTPSIWSGARPASAIARPPLPRTSLASLEIDRVALLPSRGAFVPFDAARRCGVWRCPHCRIPPTAGRTGACGRRRRRRRGALATAARPHTAGPRLRARVSCRVASTALSWRGGESSVTAKGTVGMTLLNTSRIPAHCRGVRAAPSQSPPRPTTFQRHRGHEVQRAVGDGVPAGIGRCR